jgi:hypothetical protein
MNGATIPGLNVELTYRHSMVPNDCNHKMTLFLVRGARRLRTFQFEIFPASRMSHKQDGTPIYGPHQHVGEKYEPIDGASILTCADYELWMREFFGRANIAFTGKYSPPEPLAGQLDLGI